jgi:transketolase C-terminal domain/subunit
MASLSQSPVMAAFSHTGFQDAADGASHQSLTYLSAVSSIPHLNVVNVASAKEAEEYMYAAAKKIATDREAGHDGESYIFFLGRENFALELKDGLGYELHKPQRLTDGHDVAIVATGSLVGKALKAYNELKEKGIEATVINHSFVNNTDWEAISRWIEEAHGRVVTVEDHQLTGGMGAQLTHRLMLMGADFSVKSLAVHGEFGQSAYSADELYAKHHVDSGAIVNAAVELTRSKGSTMNIDKEVLMNRWKEISQVAMKKWDSISEKDLEKVRGNAVALVGLVQEKFGVSREEATKKVEELMAKYPKEELKAKATETASKVLDTANTLASIVKDKLKK